SFERVIYIARPVGERFDRERALRTGRDEIARVELDKLNVADAPEAFQPSHRDNDRVEASVGDAREAGIDVATQRNNLDSTIYAKELEAASRRRGAELRAFRQRRERDP